MIKLPTLDDRTYAQLADEARALVPTLAPTWTDHNPSDPGIMLLELFSWLAEMVVYRIDRVPERSYRTFLRLLRGPNATPDLTALALDEAIRSTVTELRERHRAITEEDFEYLALQRWPTQDAAAAMGVLGVVRRALGVGQQTPATLKQLWTDPAHVRADGHVTLVIVPDSLSAARADLASFARSRRVALELTNSDPTNPSYVDCGKDPSLQLTSDLTLSAWIFPRSLGKGRQGILCKQAAGEFELVLEPTGALTFYHADAVDGATAPAGVPPGRWSHVAVVRSAAASTVSFFRDGKLVGAPAPLQKAAVASSAPLWIGRRSNGADLFDGFIRDACLWKIARGATDLGGDLKRVPAGDQAGIVACYRLDDGGAVAKDAATPDTATSRPRDGTLVHTGWRDAVRPLDPSPALLAGLAAFIDEWRLLTTRVDLTGYRPLPVAVGAGLYLTDDGVPAAVSAAAVSALDQFFDPLTGGRGAGWPFGRSLFVSDVAAALDGLPGVDFVTSVTISLTGADATDTSRPPAILGDDGNPSGVALLPYELPALILDPTAFNLFRRVGTKWQKI
jgi:hypothetical protein